MHINVLGSGMNEITAEGVAGPVATVPRAYTVSGTAGHFDTLRTEPMRLDKVEAQGVAPRAERTLFTDTGPGVVETLWMAIGGNNANVLDGRIRIYNGPSLDVDVDLGTLLVTHWGANGVFGNNRISVDYNGVLGFQFNYPIPYGPEGIRIAFYNIPGAGQDALIYSMVTRRKLATDYGKRLHCAGKRYADERVSRSASAVTTLADISGAGSLVYHAQVGGDAAANDSWMERNIAVTVDGTMAIESSGTEDWFGSAWYFNQRKNYKVSPDDFVGTDKPSFNEHVVGMATDLWGKFGGIPFTTSCKVQAKSEPGCTTGDTLCWCILYYKEL